MQGMTLRLIVWAAVVALCAWLLPWWATVIIAVLGLGMTQLPSRRAVQVGIERSRGFVLRQAVVKADGFTFEPLDADARRLRLDLTVRPRAGNSRVRPWWPHEFRFQFDVGHEVRAGTIERKQGAQWTAMPKDSLTGEQRLRLQIVAPAKAASLTIHYFLEDIAHVDLGSLPPKDRVV
jgi:hypothetical protein